MNSLFSFLLLLLRMCLLLIMNQKINAIYSSVDVSAFFLSRALLLVDIILSYTCESLLLSQ